MRPIKLVMQAFGPYPEKETIDFEELQKSGIFLIKGPTGSGKTTIFDAISMALYGKSTGEDGGKDIGRNDFSAWRCNRVKWDKETIVEFTFEARDGIYQFVRRLIPKRTNINTEFAVLKLDPAGNFVTIGAANMTLTKMAEKAEELIGLNASQFRQVVLLPQGKFEEFIEAGTAEKEDILKRLFNADAWGNYAVRMQTKVNARKKEFDDIKNKIGNALFEERVNDISELETVIEKKEAELEEAKKKFESFNIKEKTDLLEADKLLSQKFEYFDKLLYTKKGLEAGYPKYIAAKENLKNAVRAEALREPIREKERTENELKLKKRDTDVLEQKTALFLANENKAKNALDEHNKKTVVKEQSEKKAVLSSKRPIYENIDDLRRALDAAGRAVKEIEASYAVASGDYEKAVSASKNAYLSYTETEKSATDIRNAYYAGIYGEIAGTLTENTPCPVCGSMNHPAPAKKSTSVSKIDVENAEEKQSRAKKQWENAESARKSSEENLNRIKSEKELRAQSRTVAAERVKSASESMTEGISDLRDLDKEISACNRVIDEFNMETANLEREYNTAHDALERHNEKIKNLKTDIELTEVKHTDALLNLEKALKESGFLSEAEAKEKMLSIDEQREIQGKISKEEAMLKKNKDEIAEAEPELKDKIRPDASAFANRQNEINEVRDRFTGLKAQNENDIKRLTEKLTRLKKDKVFYDANIDEVLEEDKFAKMLVGSNGIGLQRYVLGIMFDRIISEANKLLSKIHDGRYKLFRSDDKGVGRMKGLELVVHDACANSENGQNNNGMRNVRNLSGGEKFLVALTLSIGMSVVAQCSGLKIEALFIDEGFGTLDDESISEAMDVLESVKRGRGMIGIISHVKLLENNIPCHVEVVKDPSKGSHIVQ